MVISVNPTPEKKLFESLLNDTVATLSSESKKKEEKYLALLASKLENEVVDIMKEQAIGTEFENSIELVSGQKFPDIIANKFYGVEVKTTKLNHWTTTGNSVLEGTRVEGIERIFMLFGKMVLPIEFRCKPYEDCLSDIVVTHSPRYLVNMELSKGETIFDKLKIPYDTLRTAPNPIKHITDYYRKFLKHGEEVWWLDQDESKSTGLIIRLWNNLSATERRDLVLKSMIFFPEIFSNQTDKFNRIGVWLVNSHGIVCPNVRDMFSAGGQGNIIYNNKVYYNIPKILINMTSSLTEIKEFINESGIGELILYWNTKTSNPHKTWVDLIIRNTKHFKLKINLEKYLQDNFLTN
jgi:hypothetical protein